MRAHRDTQDDPYSVAPNRIQDRYQRAPQEHETVNPRAHASPTFFFPKIRSYPSQYFFVATCGGPFDAE